MTAFAVGDQTLVKYTDALGSATWCIGEVKQVDTLNQRYHVQLPLGGVIVWFAEANMYQIVRANYNYTTPGGMVAPVAGGITHPSNALNTLRIANTDANAVDHMSFFATLNANDIIAMGQMTWTILTATPGASYLEITVSPAQQAALGLYLVEFRQQP